MPPSTTPHQFEVRWATSNTTQREGQVRAGAAGAEAESLPTPAALAGAQPPPRLGARARPHQPCLVGGGPQRLRSEGARHIQTPAVLTQWQLAAEAQAPYQIAGLQD